MPKFRKKTNNAMDRQDRMMDIRMGRPNFIGLFRLPPGVQ